MLKIRLQRTGKKNQATFRIVLTEKQRAAKKTPLEVLGFYNPRTKEFGIKDEERLQYWIGQHVEFSPTVNNLLIDKGLLKGDKVKSWKPKVKPAQAEGGQAGEVKSEASVGNGSQDQSADEGSESSSESVEQTEKKDESGEGKDVQKSEKEDEKPGEESQQE